MRLRLIVPDIRSCHNVGSILRTADGLGIEHVYLSGYTPYPAISGDQRLPHIRGRLNAQIRKTALGAENTVSWSHHEQTTEAIKDARGNGFRIIALEQTEASEPLHTFVFPDQTTIVLGSEVEGIDPAVLALTDACIEIPMIGAKESFNVVQAAAMVLYHCRFIA